MESEIRNAAISKNKFHSKIKSIYYDVVDIDEKCSK